jgi:hypothetical protein
LYRALSVCGLCDEVIGLHCVQTTSACDEWRRFALQATKMFRGRTEMNVETLAGILNTCADKELAMWKSLRGI